MGSVPLTIGDLTGSQVDALLMVANEEVEVWSVGDQMWPGVRQAIRQLVTLGLVEGPPEGGTFYQLADAAEPVLTEARALEVVGPADGGVVEPIGAVVADPDRSPDGFLVPDTSLAALRSKLARGRDELVVLSSVDQWWCEACGGRYGAPYPEHGLDCAGQLVAVRVLIVKRPDG